MNRAEKKPVKSIQILGIGMFIYKVASVLQRKFMIAVKHSVR
ncbi:hypothetical protein D515_04052 [Grimontia indica]|uniref:Uncharacterized protein n=1 Tax=Grimontia indica TaxID=1056512 RepID=R1IK96_9GAMM|nr:hypothetical protein D515_04052 [Grimontia indica]